MEDLIVDAECIWRTNERQVSSQVKIWRPKVNASRTLFEARYILPGYSKTRETQGFDLAFIKNQVAVDFDIGREFNDGELLDIAGNPISIRDLVSLSIGDYATVRLAPYVGYLTNPRWQINRNCRWVSNSGAPLFRLRISAPEKFLGQKKVYAFSADHPLLGNFTLREWSLGSVWDFIRHGLPEFAAWHGAKIVDEGGAPIDFEALADEVTETTPEQKEEEAAAVRSLLREHRLRAFTEKESGE